MMRLLFVALSVYSLQSFAVVYEKACSATTKVCASYEAEAPFTTTQEGRFKLIVESSDQSPATLIKADLWMQMGNHGHGSSPLKIVPVSPVEFDVTKAYFVMKGKWQMRVTYEQDLKQETLILPVQIAQ